MRSGLDLVAVDRVVSWVDPQSIEVAKILLKMALYKKQGNYKLDLQHGCWAPIRYARVSSQSPQQPPGLNCEVQVRLSSPKVG